MSSQSACSPFVCRWPRQCRSNLTARKLVLLALLFIFGLSVHSSENLVLNGNFESNTEGWSALWTRDPDTGRAEIDSQTKHDGQHALKITYSGANDWSFAQNKSITVNPGDIFALSAWIKHDDAGQCGVSVVTRQTDGIVGNWTFANTDAIAAPDWQQVHRKFAVPDNTTTIQLRFTGHGKTTAWLDDVSLTKEGNVADLEKNNTSKNITLENASLRITFAQAGSFNVEDKRNNRTWNQLIIGRDIIIRSAAAESPTHARFELLDLQNDLTLKADFTLDAIAPELRITLDSTGPLAHDLAYPHPFATEKSNWLVVPMNEGILYPADDATIHPMRLIAYGGHGISMPWFGAFDPATGAGEMTILETPDDASIDIAQAHSAGVSPARLLHIAPLWQPSRGNFAYTRALTCIFFDHGGFVAQAKRYRDYAQKSGLFKTLAQKKSENPNVDLLVGAANIWNWDMKKIELCKELKSAGVERVLFSASEDATAIPEIEKLGYLAGRYDIYQDVWPPDQPKWANHDGWPDDLVLLPNGDWMRGWAHHETKPDGTKVVFEGGVICSACQLPRAKIKIPEDLKAHPYTARFIDTTTASPWRECYNPRHPLTRSDDRKNKMALLDFVSKDCRLVTGTETGIDPSVPFVHYYEGMLSLGPYRLPDSGRNMLRKEPATPDVLKFQTGHYYRVPLWELVYHDCVCAQWYWGDYNNKSPDVWPRRDLINILYATAPMYMFNSKEWSADKTRIVESAKTVCAVARRFGYDELRSHEFLTPDHSIQKTQWASGVSIIVNFGDKPFTLPSGAELKPLSFTIE
ncbi:MAG TPA: glycoside hydrolase [Planctomycetota bacterium]|nr:glycoside hydrolase [Planctomycetota bacterium]